jgi:hypothetical protein
MATDSKINYKYGIVSISFMSYDVLYALCCLFLKSIPYGKNVYYKYCTYSNLVEFFLVVDISQTRAI